MLTSVIQNSSNVSIAAVFLILHDVDSLPPGEKEELLGYAEASLAGTEQTMTNEAAESVTSFANISNKVFKYISPCNDNSNSCTGAKPQSNIMSVRDTASFVIDLSSQSKVLGVSKEANSNGDCIVAYNAGNGDSCFTVNGECCYAGGLTFCTLFCGSIGFSVVEGRITDTPTFYPTLTPTYTLYPTPDNGVASAKS